MALPSSPAETGRANRKTVLALKARAALYAASPLFNPTDNKELWYRAAKANKEREIFDNMDNLISQSIQRIANRNRR